VAIQTVKRLEDQNYLQIIPVIEFPTKTTWRLIWLEGKKYSPAALAFLEFVHKRKNAITKKYFSFEGQ
jgi:hypothetical protein